MRTTKRFTPKVLSRFRKLGRGLGTNVDYVPWHRVGRGDPSSRGRSHLQQWKNRQRELLSDGERNALFFAVMIQNLIDLREQFPLATEDATHELAVNVGTHAAEHFPGTLALAKRLGIEPPEVTDMDTSCWWVMTTDLLLTLKRADGSVELLAVAFKSRDYEQKNRTVELLSLEREYWVARDVPWLLITPQEYDQRVALTLQRTMPWALGRCVTDEQQLAAAATLERHYGCSYWFLINQLERQCGSKDLAQRAFWQGVWSGKIPIDLRLGWRPRHPLALLSKEEFCSLNPIASRRSAWI